MSLARSQTNLNRFLHTFSLGQVGTPPNGGGGGTGLVKNAHIEDVQVNGVDLALYITSCLSYKLAIEPGQDPLKYCNVRYA